VLQIILLAYFLIGFKEYNIKELHHIKFFFNIFVPPKPDTTMSKISLLIPAMVLLAMLSCTKGRMVPVSEIDSTLKEMVSNAAASNSLDYWILPESTDFNSIPQDPLNPLSTEKVALGKLLFYETAFGTEAAAVENIGTFSCATCHLPSAGFRPGSAQGIADGGVGFGINGEERVRNTNYAESDMDVQGARPLSLLSVAFVENTMWNGSFGSTNVNEGTEHLWVGKLATNNLGLQGMEAQNIEGLETHKMHYDLENITENGYKEMFDAAFSDVPEEDRYNNIRASFALSAYLRTVFPSKAPFQDWLKGDPFAMTEDEKAGAMLFFGKAACTNCHSGPGFSSVEFHAVGVNDMFQRPSFGTSASDLRNFGRGGFTGISEDNYKFKVPQLYNMRDTKFYFHGSSKTNLRDVVEYFNEGIGENQNVPAEQISDKFNPLFLSDEEIDQLTLFLDSALRDPDLMRYQPDEVLSGNCFPNGDFQSQLDLGCQ